MLGPLQTAFAGACATLGALSMAASLLIPPEIEIRALSYDYAADVATYFPAAPGVSAADRRRLRWEADVIRLSGDGDLIAGKACAGAGVGRYWDRPAPLRKSLDWMTLDRGCRDRLTAGEYELVVTIYPSRGDLAPVAYTRFSVP